MVRRHLSLKTDHAYTVAQSTSELREISIRDLGIIGDQRTAAAVTTEGTIVWYCAGRFDRPSLLASLLEPNAGSWLIELRNSAPAGRCYLEESGILETGLAVGPDRCTVTDWMPVGPSTPAGAICRILSEMPGDTTVTLRPRPDYGRKHADIVSLGDAVSIDGAAHYVYASHSLIVDDETVSFRVPRGAPGWAVLSEEKLSPPPTRADLERWLETSLAHWRELTASVDYEGPYEREIAASIRAIQLVTHEPSGGIVAAVTTSLPEVPGGSRNWDYRYAWLRDAGMIVSALTRLGGGLPAARRYLDFMCGSRGSSSKYPMAILTTLDGKAAPKEEILDFVGFGGSRPVRVGNNAGDQLQLDGFGNVLLAAKLLYQRIDDRPHWDAVEEIAEFLVAHWREPDHGIWEEARKGQYTASKVVLACGLDSVAAFSTDHAQATRWRKVVHEIRDFVSANCLTKEGAYAALAGGDAVDVSAALFAAWGYTDANAPEMRRTIAVLEREHSWDGCLFWRHLECADASPEGAFLAGTFWVAQYWALAGAPDKARRVIDATLAYANDLGLFAEEADPRAQHREQMLGNMPQSFTHAAFIGAVIDLKAALSTRDQSNAAEQEQP